jgi:hypothetical protein
MMLALASFLAAPEPAHADDAQAQKPKPWYEKVIVKGWAQFDATFPEGRSTVGNVSNLRVRRARPTIQARLDPCTMVQFQMDLSTGKAGSGASNATIVDTFVERIIPKIAIVRFGQELLPFGYEVHEDNAALRSPLELSFAAESIALAERDIGLTLHADTPEDSLFHWEIGVYNGQGFRSADSNANKTIVGRIAHGPYKWLQFGVSGMTGTFRDGRTGKDHDREVLAGELQLRFSKPLKISGEIYNARFVDSVAAPTKQARFTGGYLMWEGWVGPLNSIPFVRYQRTYGDLEYQSWDIGWRWQYAPNQRVTVQYDIVKGHSNNSFGARWQVGF